MIVADKTGLSAMAAEAYGLLIDNQQFIRRTMAADKERYAAELQGQMVMPSKETQDLLTRNSTWMERFEENYEVVKIANSKPRPLPQLICADDCECGHKDEYDD